MFVGVVFASGCLLCWGRSRWCQVVTPDTTGISGIIAKEAGVQILNEIGQVVYSQTLATLNGTIEVKPDVQLAKGVYLINLETNGVIERLKMTVE